MKFTDSIKKNHQFRLIYDNGVSMANRLIVVYVLKNGLDENRLGVSVSKKVGNSVIRNRVKRLIKESYRLLEQELNCGFDIVVIARQQSSNANFYDIKNGLSYLLKKMSVYKKN